MRGKSFSARLLFALILSTLTVAFSTAPLLAEDADGAKAATSPMPLITQPVDEHQLTVLKGNIHPLARPQFDLGTSPASLPE